MSPPHEDRARRHLPANQEESSHQELTHWHFEHELPGLQSPGNCLLFKFPLCDSIIAVPSDSDKSLKHIIFKNLLTGTLKFLVTIVKYLFAYHLLYIIYYCYNVILLVCNNIYVLIW